jgi:hypothetical protein
MLHAAVLTAQALRLKAPKLTYWMQQHELVARLELLGQLAAHLERHKKSLSFTSACST